MRNNALPRNGVIYLYIPVVASSTKKRMTAFNLRTNNYTSKCHLFLSDYKILGYGFHISFHGLIIKEIAAKLGTK